MISLGPAADETWFRLQVSGKESTKHLSISPDQLAAIRRVLAGKTPDMHLTRASADAFGVWHIRVRRDAPGSPRSLAGARLRYELEPRQGAPLNPDVWKRVTRVETMEDDDWFVFREGNPR